MGDIITLFGEGSFEVPLIAGTSNVSLSTKQTHRLKNLQITGTSDLDSGFDAIQGFDRNRIKGLSELEVDLSYIGSFEVINISGTSLINDVSLRLNSEPNILLDNLSIQGTSNVQLLSNKKSFLNLSILSESSLDVHLKLNKADYANLSVFAVLAPTFEKDKVDIVAGRLIIDNEEVPVKRAVLNHSSNDLIKVLEITLTKPIRNQITFNSNFKFDVKKYPGTWETIFQGNFSQENYSFSYEQDSLSATITDALFERFNKFPQNPLIIYNPLELEMNKDNYEKPVDIDGNYYDITFIQNSDLRLRDILEFVFIDNLGFDDVFMTVDNYYINNPVQFDITRTFLSVINGLVGMYEPLIFEKDNVVWILDTTQSIPDGIELREFNPSNSRCSKSVTNNKIDGYEIEYTSTSGEFFIPRNETIFKNITSILRNRYQNSYRDYYNFARPNILLRTELISERITQFDDGVTVGESYTEYQFDSQGTVTSDKKIITGYIPDLNNNGAITLINVLDKRNFYTYSAVRTKNQLRRKVLSQKITTIDGLYAIDTQNLSFEQPFLQPFMDAYIAGNLTLDMSVDFGPLKTLVNDLKLSSNGQTKSEITVYNHLLKTVETGEGEQLSGEGHIPQQTNKKVIYWNPNVSESERRVLGTISIGEIGLKNGIPLVDRILKKIKEKKGSITAYETSYDLTKTIGSGFKCIERENRLLGVGLIDGIQIVFDFNPTSPKVSSTYNLKEL